jgi:hypothetical protein
VRRCNECPISASSQVAEDKSARERPDHWVKPFKGLIEDDDRRVYEKGKGERNALRFALRESLAAAMKDGR